MAFVYNLDNCGKVFPVLALSTFQLYVTWLSILRIDLCLSWYNCTDATRTELKLHGVMSDNILKFSTTDGHT